MFFHPVSHRGNKRVKFNEMYDFNNQDIPSFQQPFLLQIFILSSRRPFLPTNYGHWPASFVPGGCGQVYSISKSRRKLVKSFSSSLTVLQSFGKLFFALFPSALLFALFFSALLFALFLSALLFHSHFEYRFGLCFRFPSFRHSRLISASREDLSGADLLAVQCIRLERQADIESHTQSMWGWILMEIEERLSWEKSDGRQRRHLDPTSSQQRFDFKSLFRAEQEKEILFFPSMWYLCRASSFLLCLE